MWYNKMMRINYAPSYFVFTRDNYLGVKERKNQWKTKNKCGKKCWQ